MASSSKQRFYLAILPNRVPLEITCANATQPSSLPASAGSTIDARRVGDGTDSSGGLAVASGGGAMDGGASERTATEAPLLSLPLPDDHRVP